MIPSRTDLLGKQMPGDVITEKEADVLRYACWESYITWKSAAVLKEGLKEHGMEQLMREIEMPLVFVLSDMETGWNLYRCQCIKRVWSETVGFHRGTGTENL